MWLPMLVLAIMTSLSLVSCKDDPDPIIEDEVFVLTGSRWDYTSNYEEDGVKMTESYTFTFSATTATMTYTLSMSGNGTTVTLDPEKRNYSYVLSGDLVVFTPLEPNVAHLEGKISQKIKMEIYNVDMREVIGTFYKK